MSDRIPDRAPGKPIPLSEPYLGGRAREYLLECLETNYVSSVGPFVDRFERQFAEAVGSRYAVACCNGTAAIHLALRLLGIGPGDEVAVPTLTFIASANPIMYERATPLLCDIEPRTWNLDAERLVAEMDRRARAGLRQIRAVEAVHILGHPAEMELLVDACERHGVLLFEDASEALGARYRSGRFAGRHVGTISCLGCFSFNGNKIVTTGGGGMITTDDEQLAKRAKHLTTQARLPGPEYRHDEVGYNYRLTNLAAALGVAQMELLPEFLERKRAIAAAYDAALPPGITPPPRATWADSSLWLYSVLVDPAVHGRDRTALMQHLAANNVQARPIWSPLHTMPIYAQSPRLGGEVAESVFSRGLSLPCSVGLSPEDQQRVISLLATR